MQHIDKPEDVEFHESEDALASAQLHASSLQAGFCSASSATNLTRSLARHHVVQAMLTCPSTWTGFAFRCKSLCDKRVEEAGTVNECPDGDEFNEFVKLA